MNQQIDRYQPNIISHTQTRYRDNMWQCLQVM